MVQKSQLAQLAEAWPRTYHALCTTFYTAPDWGKTRPDKTNDAGYVLAGLHRYETIARDRHAQREITRTALDQAAAREVHYQAARGRVFLRPCAALSTCWANLPIERPEKIFAALARERTRENAPADRR